MRKRSIHMVNKFSLPIWLALLATLGLCVPIQQANAMSADQYFADGNRLFRDDLYWAALLRYRQAAGEGLDTPLLHYNMGIAHYRAGQHIRARASLSRALDDPSLRVAAHYNLGLNAYKLGDLDEALRWFRLARDQNESEKLRRFALIAISRIRDERARPDDLRKPAADRKKKRAFTDLQLRARVSIGSDSNVFRSPDQPYIDLSNSLAPVVTPEVKSGLFMPVNLSAKYLINSLKFEGFYVAYKLKGRYFQDKDLENANEFEHEASFGSEYRRKEGGRERRVRSAFKVAQRNGTYYDPDTGDIRTVNGVGVADRLDYLRYGPEVSFRQSGERLAFGANIKAQLLNYESQVAVPEYDHEYFLLRLYGQYKFTASSLLRITAEGFRRRYGDRIAFDLDGQQRLGNPHVHYDYYSLKLTARQRVFDSLWFGFDVKRMQRIDQYVGYNDYTLDSFGFEVHWSPNDRFSLEASGAYQLYDFANAFAFNAPLAGRKTKEATRIKLTGSFKMTRRLSLVAEVRYHETVSNDFRLQYDRSQFQLGVIWEQ